MRKLKLFLSLLMVMLLSIEQMWATDYEYQMVTSVSQVTEGTYVVGALRSESATDNFYFGKASVSSGDWVVSDNYVTVAASNGVRKFDATSLPTGAVEFEFTGDNTDGFTIKNGTKYLYYTAASNRKLAFATNGSTFKWTVAAKSSPLISGGVVLKKKSGLNGNYTISENSTAVGAIRGYANTTMYRAIYLFKKQEKPVSDKPTVSVSPDGGNFVGSVQVTLTPSEGATAYYTTNSSIKDNPTTSTWTEYDANNKPSFSNTTTLYVSAVKNSVWSESVVTKTFTKVEPYTSIADLFEDKTNSDQQVYVTFGGWKVSVVKGGQAFVTDGTNGLIIYQSGHGLEEGDILSGTVQCALVNYNGAVELKGITKTMQGLTVTSGTIVPAVKTIAQANALSEINTGILIKLENVTYNGTAFVDANSNSIAPYTSFYDYSEVLTSGKNYNVVGIVQQYQSHSQIYPRKSADIEEVQEQGAPEAPEFTPASNTYDEATSVTITCETDEAVIYYTMTSDGTTPATPDTDDDSQIYNGAINLNANGTYKFKAVAFKNNLTSTEVSATYVIDLPLPSHDYTYNFDFTAIDGFNSWNQSYTEHTVGYDILPAEPDGVADVNVVFASANKQGDNQPIIDRPVTKGGDVELKLLPATKKYITAVKFACQQWTTKAQTITLHYSTDGGSTYTVLDPSVTSTNFTIQCLDLPETTNAVKITFSSTSNQVGLSSVHFDLEDKPVVKKTVTITAPAAVEGTLVVKNGEDPISDGDEIEVGTTLKIFAEAEDGYTLNTISVLDEDDVPVSINSDNEFVVPNKNVTVSAIFEEIQNPATLTLNVQGTESPYQGSYNVGAVVTLPSTATACEGNVFVGWSEVLIATPGAKPTTQYYNKGAQYTLANASQTLYAVYAQGSAATWQITSDDLEILDTETTSAYTKYAGDQTKGTISYNIADVMPATGGNDGKLQIKKSSGKLYNKTPFAADIVSVVIEGYNIAVFEGEDAISSTPTSGAISGTGTDAYTYTFSSGKRYFHIQNNTNNAAYPASITVNLQPEYTNYTTSCIVPVNVPEPEFDVDEDTYTAVQTVKIDNYDDDYIYVYTLDGSEPTADANLEPEGTAAVYNHTNGIAINVSCTLKARAYDEDGNYSDVTSAAYIINLPLSSMQAIFDAATSTATSKSIAFSDAWVVSGVSADGHTAYLTDGTKGLILYNYSDDMDLAVGNTLSGTKECTLVLYKGAAELKDFTKESLTVGTGGTVSPASIAPANLTGVNTGALISLTNWKYDGTKLTKETTSIQPYTTLFDYEDAFEENRYYNVSGIYQQFNSTKEILPRSTDDIEELTQNAPTMAWHVSSTDDTEIAANAIYSINKGDAFAPVFVTNSNGVLTYTSNNPDVAEIDVTNGTLTLKNVAGNTVIKCAVAADVDQNLAADELSFTLRVREESNSDNVVILAKQGGKWYAMKNTVTSSKAEGVEVVYVGGKIYNLTSTEQADITWKRTIDSEDNVTFQNPDTYDFLKTSGNNIVMEANESGNYQWKWNETYYRTGTQTRTFMYRAGEVNSFKSYAVSNAGDDDEDEYSSLPVVTVAIFVDGEPEPVYEEGRAGLTAGNYYTICLPKKVTAFRGASIWDLKKRNTAGSEVYLEEAQLPFAAGTPFIIQATEATLEVVYEGDATSTPVENGALRGTLTGLDVDAFAGLSGNIYILKENAIRPRTAGNWLSANRAYIDYEALQAVSETPASAPGKRVRAIPMQEYTTTGMDELNASETPVKMIIDGQLFIIRGEKMYDTTGRLVK